MKPLDNPPDRPDRRRAFTLVEVLVAVTVIALILVLLLQVFVFTTSATRIAMQKMEGGDTARVVFDSLNADLMNLVSQQSLTVFAKSSGLNSELVLVTMSRGSQTGTRCMSVGYKLSSEGALMRYTKPILWNNSALVTQALTVEDASNPTLLAGGILRFQAVAVLDDGSLVPLAPNPMWNDALVDGQAVADSFFALNLSDTTTGRKRVRSLIVGLVALDAQGYHILESTRTLAKITTLFAAPEANQVPLDLWETPLSNGTLNGFPKPAVAVLQAFQHTYSLK